MAEQCCFSSLHFLGAVEAGGASRGPAGSPSPAISLPPSPAPAADFPFRSEKHLPVAWQRSAGGGGGSERGTGSCGSCAGASRVPVEGLPPGSGTWPGPVGAGPAVQRRGEGDPGSAGCREHRPPPAPRSSALLQAFVFHGSVSALKGRGETHTVTGRKNRT